jgi:diguanylate cyclase (GGDEF)-like protein
MRPVADLVVPGGLVWLAVVILLRPGLLPDTALPVLRVLPAAVWGIGILLGWYFNRTRVVFAVLVLVLADQSLQHFASGGQRIGGQAGIVFNAVALLLPLNLVGFSLVSERGLLTGRGLVRLGLILSQPFLVAFICRPAQQDLANLLQYRIMEQNLAAWTPLPQPSLVIFAAGLALLVIRYFSRRDPIGEGFVWALVASFTGLQVGRAGWSAGHFLAAAGLILAVSVIEMSYRIAFHDELTGLRGRRALKEDLLKLGGQYAVAMVDIDHFKRVNDRYGHPVGDQVLRMVSSKLDRAPGGGTAYRYGGEEFALVFAGQSAKDVMPFLESLRMAVEGACFVLRGPDRPRKKPDKPKQSAGPRNAVLVTVSIGVAERDEKRRRPDHVIKAADDALYRAKNAGRNRVKL